MATKMKINGLAGMHTAGIYSDMTVDGPEIGTLVVIVDRAKNLPNRKTIGKQDPYCAARLGKEAKKTETDRRGGQTPRWDQELRFTVHDSADYYQLKVSVFNDDKKTDLIGETWVSLQDVVVPGGGQSDIWHNLSCKGKYAGEIRIEITYYDTRPKQEKAPAAKQAAANGVEDGGKDSLKGPRHPKTPVKRRPLPSDPVTGAPPPSAIPDHVQTPPRGYQSPTGAPPPSAIPDHIQTPPRGYQSPTGAPPSAIPDHVQTPPRGYQSPTGTPEHVQNSRGYPSSNGGPEYSQTPPRGYQASPGGAEYNQTPPRGYQSSTGTPDYVQTPSRGYPSQSNIPEHRQTPPRSHHPSVTIPDHVQTPPRGYQSPSYVPDQSPLQRVEYNTPAHFSPGDYENSHSPNMNGYVAATPSAQPTSHERYEIYDPLSKNDYQPTNHSGRGRYDDEDERIDPRDTYNSRYDLPELDDFGPPPSPGPPPPPPAHGSKHGSSHTSPSPAMQSHGSYGFPSDTRPSNPYEIPQNDFHRRSMPTYSQPKSYQAYSPPKNGDQYRKSPGNDYQESPPRHHSYDSRYNADYGSMQPTVEDAPPSPSQGPLSRPRGSGSRSSRQDDRRYEDDPSPAPLNLSGRGSSASSRNNNSSTPNHQYSNSVGYNSSNSQISLRDRSHTGTSVSSRTSYNTMSQQYQQGQQRHPSTGQAFENPSDYGPPPVPPTLVAGMDPTIAQEISDRIYDEKRASLSQNSGNSARGRYHEPPQYQAPPHSSSYNDTTMVPYVPAAASSASYDDRQSRYATAMVPTVKPRAISPDPRRLSRKSVSPSPAPSESRHLSGVPFGPDSYNLLNPKISGSTSTPSLSARYDTQEPDPNAKIITHDGREIDPSDHIPESNYAPLLESKAPKYASQLPDRNYRPPQNTPQSSSGRKPLKQAARPQSMAAPASSPIYMSSGPTDPSTPQTGRNRLQKKANRMSAMPAPHSSPLAPITPYQNNSHTPRSSQRPNTSDYHSTENYAPSYGPGYRGSAGPPPLPAKVPISAEPPPQPTGPDAWALLEEMKNIDLGSGRARRRNY